VTSKHPHGPPMTLPNIRSADVGTWHIASLRCPQQFGRFRSKAAIDLQQSEFMAARPCRVAHLKPTTTAHSGPWCAKMAKNGYGPRGQQNAPTAFYWLGVLQRNLRIGWTPTPFTGPLSML
jgi:hypothetical protein